MPLTSGFFLGGGGIRLGCKVGGGVSVTVATYGDIQRRRTFFLAGLWAQIVGGGGAASG